MSTATSHKHGQTNDNFFQRRNAFLRSIGFEIPFISGYRRNILEQPKSVIQTSRRLALARSGVHILPCIITVIMICFNLYSSYLGRTLPGEILDPSMNIALLQVAAKVQELLVVASMTTIVMHVIRQELCSGASVPLGMISGGFMFTTMSYFWSPELCGSLAAKCSIATRTRIYAVLAIGGIVAALAGPASAVLMIPRDQQWNAGGTKTFLPGPSELWWPDTLNSTNSKLGDFCLVGDLPEYGICSNGGYSAFQGAKDKFDIYQRPAYLDGTHQNITTNLIFGPQGVDFANNFRLLPGIRYNGNFRGYACETAVVGVQTAEAIYHQQILHDWKTEVMSIPFATLGKGSTLSEYKYYTSLTSTTSSRIPAVRVSCTPAQPLSGKDVYFPILDPTGCTGRGEATGQLYIANLSEPSDHIKVSWLDLPKTFGTASAGFVVVLPQNSNTNSHGAVACSIDARWTNGTIITSDLRSFFTSPNLDKNFKAPVRLAPTYRGPPTAIGQPNYSEFRPVILNPTSSRISLKSDWLYTSSSTNGAANDSNTIWTETNLENFLSSLSLAKDLFHQTRDSVNIWNSEIPGVVNRTVALEWTMALIVTDALSRLGSELVVNSTGPVSGWTPNSYNKSSSFKSQLLQRKKVGTALLKPTDKPVIEESVIITIGGYSYFANKPTDYAAMALLLVHLLLAVCHVLYTVCYTSQSSSAWDSLTELMVLMQNSRPANHVLRNVNAGIKGMGTYGALGRLRATTSKPAIRSMPKIDPKANSGSPQNKEQDGIYNIELIFDEPWQSSLTSKAGQEVARGQYPSDPTLKLVQPDVKYGQPDSSQSDWCMQTSAWKGTGAHRTSSMVHTRVVRRCSI